MSKLLWDQAGERVYETGVDHGVLYLRSDNSGEYDEAFVWNGLTTVTESPSGAEASPQYADNIKYINLVSAEEFGATIEALTYPSEFGRCDGSAEPETGVFIGQQVRETFGFHYRTKVGTDLDPEAGYKLHLVYNALTAPSEKAFASVNESPEATPFSWEITTTPVEVGTIGGKEYKPTATLTIDSTKVDADTLQELEDILFGTAGADARLPLPAEIIGMFAAVSLTEVNLATPANQPTYVSATHIVTLPSVTGIQWKVNGVNKAPGAQPALTVGQTANVTAHPLPTYVLTDNSDNDWAFAY